MRSTTGRKPGEYLGAVDVQDRHQVGEAMGHHDAASAGFAQNQVILILSDGARDSGIARSWGDINVGRLGGDSRPLYKAVFIPKTPLKPRGPLGFLQLA